jgi:hypothetical protein
MASAITTETEAARGAGRHRRWAWLVALAVLLPLAVRSAYFGAFGELAMWDDEGYLMVSADSFLRGHALYDEVYSQYGPFYYLLAWLAWGVGPLRIDHATARWLVVATWIGCALLSAAVVGRATRQVGLAALAFAASMLVLARLPAEPAHPQGLLLVLLAGAVLAFQRLAVRRPRACALVVGAVCAAAATTKANVGLFLLASCSIAMLELAPASRPQRVLRVLFWLSAAALPWLVVGSAASTGWVATYAASVTCTVLGIGLAVARAPRPAPQFAARDLAAFALAFAATALVPSVFVLARGTSVPGLLEGTLLGPIASTAAYRQELAPAAGAPFAWGASLALAALLHVLGARRPEAADRVLDAARVAFGALVLAAVWRGDFAAVIELWAPFAWIAVRPSRGAALDPLRVFLAATSMLQLLHAFPVAGSQQNWAAWLVVWLALLALGDVAGTFLRAHAPDPTEAARRALAVRIAGALALAASVVAVALRMQQHAARYAAEVALDLPGTARMRIEEPAATTFGFFARNAERAEAFFSVPGMNSVYLWAQKPPPTTHLATSWNLLFDRERQARALADLREHEELLVLALPWLIADAVPERAPLACFLRDEVRPVGRIGPYEVRARGAAEPGLVDCVQSGTGVLRARVARRPGSEVARVVVADAPSGTVLADSAAPGGPTRLEIRTARDAPRGARGGLALDRDVALELACEGLDRRTAAAPFPVVRLIGPDGAVLARLPFLR